MYSDDLADLVEANNKIEYYQGLLKILDKIEFEVVSGNLQTSVELIDKKRLKAVQALQKWKKIKARIETESP